MLNLLLSLLLSSAHADGGYYPSKGIAKLPAIPIQRAAIFHKEGTETLILESQLQGEGKDFGWVIPIPAEPKEIKPSTPGTLLSLAWGVQPEVRQDFHGIGGFCFFVIFASLFLCLKKFMTFTERLIVVGVVGILASISIGKPISMARGPGLLSVKSEGRIGSYDISTLKAKDSKALLDWLDKNGFYIPDTLQPAVDEYVKEGWRFITAKLSTDGSGKALPHPLKISFPAKDPVYPMRLTALAGGTMDLELYVVADKAADVEGLQRIFCDQLEPSDYSWGSVLDVGRHDPHYGGKKSFIALGHPALMPLFWKGAWISKLSGKLDLGTVKEDLVIGWTSPSFQRQTFYSSNYADKQAFQAGLVIFTVGFVLFTTLWAYGPGFLWAALVFILSTGASFLTGTMVRSGFKGPIIETKAHGGTMGVRGWAEMESLLSEVRLNPRMLDKTSFKELVRSRGVKNFFTGEPLKEGDSPGDYMMRGPDEAVFFDLGGTPAVEELKPKR